MSSGLTRVRETAEAHMDEMDQLGHGWSEETVTEVAVHRGHPHVKVVKFTKPQEGKAIGADYLWWWLDRKSSVCFGMLVQAKRLTRARGRWLVDIRHNDGKQRADLLATSRQLEVPAMYSVYTGGRTFRVDLPCFHDKDPNCRGCRRMAISMISAYELGAVWSPADTATLVLNDSIPLEDLVDPHLPAGPVSDDNLPEIPVGQLRDFLLLDQDGPREIAKRIFRAVCAQRALAHSMASAEPITVPEAALFPEVPEVRGHFPGPYYRRFLQGLRQSPPPYVEELIFGSPPTPGGTIGRIINAMPPPPRRPPELAGLNVDGLVLVTL